MEFSQSNTEYKLWKNWDFRDSEETATPRSVFLVLQTQTSFILYFDSSLQPDDNIS